MFTGIVEEMGRLRERKDDRITIEASTVLDDVSIGDSISVNGCCLTVVAQGGDWWEAEVVEETWRRTNLDDLVSGSPINLERATRVSDRLGGHIVQGHVDAVGEIVEAAPNLRVKMPADLLRYVVEKGSIAIDGVSLTVAAVHDDGFSVAIIPHTQAVTTLGVKQAGDRVNLEVDIMAKYVERLVSFALTR